MQAGETAYLRAPKLVATLLSSALCVSLFLHPIMSSSDNSSCLQSHFSPQAQSAAGPANASAEVEGDTAAAATADNANIKSQTNAKNSEGKKGKKKAGVNE